MADDKNIYTTIERDRASEGVRKETRQTRYKVLGKKYKRMKTKKPMSQFVQKAPHDRTHDSKHTHTDVTISRYTQTDTFICFFFRVFVVFAFIRHRQCKWYL